MLPIDEWVSDIFESYLLPVWVNTDGVKFVRTPVLTNLDEWKEQHPGYKVWHKYKTQSDGE